MFKKYQGFDPELLKYVRLITQLGLTMISSIVIFLLIGHWIDKILNLENVFILLGILLGIAGGIVTNYKLLKRFYENK